MGSNSVIDFLFKKSRKSEEDINSEAEMVSKLKIKGDNSEDYEFADWINGKMNDLSHIMGPTKIGEEDSEARQKIRARYDALNEKVKDVTFKGMNKDELKQWLRDFYAIEQFALDNDLASEWLRLLNKSEDD